MDNKKSSSYLKALGDLKLLMKKKMIEDKLHKSQHKTMGKKEKPEDDYDEKELKDKKYSEDDEDEDDDYKREFMKGRKPTKEKGNAILVAIKMRAASKGKKEKGKPKKKA